MDNNRIGKVSKLLEDRQQSVGIIMHSNPDGDAIGSSLALCGFLKTQGYSRVHVIAPNTYASFLHWMPGNDRIIIAEKEKEKALNIIANAALLFFLDFNGFGRTDQLEKPLAASKASKVMIDHHPEPEEEGFDVVISDTAASSTAEMVYEVISALGEEDAVTLDIAQCIYAGIVTDTGSFSYGCNNPRTYEIVARLMEKGVDGARLHRLIYSTYSFDRMRLLGFCLSEKLKVMEDCQAAYISLTKNELKRFNYEEGDAEGVVNYALNIKGIKLAALFMEKDDHVKVSFRSSGNVDVNHLARTHYHGGGHINAAGGKSFLDMENTLIEFMSLVKRGFN